MSDPVSVPSVVRAEDDDAIDVEIEPVSALPSEESGVQLEQRLDLSTDPVEQPLTLALSELKRRGRRVIEALGRGLTPTQVAIGVGVALGASLLAVAAVRRGSGPRRRAAIEGRIGRSLLRELATRVALGAAATIGAQLAEAARPMLAAAIAERAAPKRRPRKSRKLPSAERDRVRHRPARDGR